MSCPIVLTARMDMNSDEPVLDVNGYPVIHFIGTVNKQQVFEFTPTVGSSKWAGLADACENSRCDSLDLSDSIHVFIFVENQAVDFWLDDKSQDISSRIRLPAANCLAAFRSAAQLTAIHKKC